jgi:hypothetical protein
MKDPYRIAEVPETTRPARHAAPASVLRPVLWLVFFAAMAANAVCSSVGASVAGVAFGVLGAGCAVALAVHHYRHRRG